MILKALFLTLTIVLTPKLPIEPEVTHVDNDGLHTLVNPLKRSVKVTLNCGQDWNYLHFDMKPRDVIFFKAISDPSVGRYMVRCWVDSYQ